MCRSPVLPLQCPVLRPQVPDTQSLPEDSGARRSVPKELSPSGAEAQTMPMFLGQSGSQSRGLTLTTQGT